MKPASAPHSRARGFTLVELSIVLVILGLLVGGVLAGQALIRAAELRAITNEFNNYKIALGAFREKYNALPGDMTNAVRFWGAATGGTADGYDSTCAASGTASTTQATCNGDGDGQVSSMPSPINGAGQYNDHELYRFWQHLANAGLVEGRFTGVRGAVGRYDAVPGQNVPRSRFPQAAWTMVWLGYYSDPNTPAVPYRNFFWFGGYLANSLTQRAILKAEDVYNIEMKIDDGKPGSGIVVNNYNTANCTNASDYILSATVVACNMKLLTGI